MEAFHSHVPLVAMTADRPRAARYAGGNQTTDQAGLYSRHVRAETQIDDTPSTPRSWRFELGRVLTAATGARCGNPGPVHVNLSFSEPLVPGVESAPIQPELLVTPRVVRPSRSGCPSDRRPWWLRAPCPRLRVQPPGRSPSRPICR